MNSDTKTKKKKNKKNKKDKKDKKNKKNKHADEEQVEEIKEETPSKKQKVEQVTEEEENKDDSGSKKKKRKRKKDAEPSAQPEAKKTKADEEDTGGPLSISFDLHQDYLKFLDIQKLILHLYGFLNTPPEGIVVQNSSKVKRVVVVTLRGLNKSGFPLNQNVMPSGSKQFTPQIGDSFFLSSPAFQNAFYELHLPCSQKSVLDPITAFFDCVFKQREKRNENISEKWDKWRQPLKSDALLESINAHVLTRVQVVLNRYPTEGLRLDDEKNNPDYDSSNPNHNLFVAIHCHKVSTVGGTHVAHITVVNERNKILYDEYITPKAEIRDYETKYSGIKKETFDKIANKKSVEEVRSALKSFFNNKKTILVGHGFEKHLLALGVQCNRIIDTAMVFARTNRGTLQKNSLKYLAKNMLGRNLKTVIDNNNNNNTNTNTNTNTNNDDNNNEEEDGNEIENYSDNVAYDGFDAAVAALELVKLKIIFSSKKNITKNNNNNTDTSGKKLIPSAYDGSIIGYPHLFDLLQKPYYDTNEADSDSSIPDSVECIFIGSKERPKLTVDCKHYGAPNSNISFWNLRNDEASKNELLTILSSSSSSSSSSKKKKKNEKPRQLIVCELAQYEQEIVEINSGKLAENRANAVVPIQKRNLARYDEHVKEIYEKLEDGDVLVVLGGRGDLYELIGLVKRNMRNANPSAALVGAVETAKATFTAIVVKH